MLGLDATANDALAPICNIVTPIGMLGYGFDEAETAESLRIVVATNAPTAIILDAGSTDSGPHKLALGTTTSPRSSYVRDIRKLLKLVVEFRVPLIFSSAGGDGSDAHVEMMIGVVREIAEEHMYALKTIGIFSEIKKSVVLDGFDKGAISPCGKVVPELTKSNIDTSPHIVAQMGPEPFLDAMNANPDFNVIVGGRAYDPSPYIAYAAWASKTDLRDTESEQSKRLWGGFTHMGKIMECGGLCATPKSPGATATVYEGGIFDITPNDPKARCTPLSVSAHTLYEKTRPDILYGPGGYLDLTASKYEQLPDGRTTRVFGGLFTFSRDAGLPYQIKLEAAHVIGYRTMFQGSIKDPILVKQIDGFLVRVKEYTQSHNKEREGSWELDFHVYGKNQVDATTGQPSELFLIGEALASSQELATGIASSARIGVVHGNYPGQKATAGNFCFGIGGTTQIQLGPCPAFSIYHLMDIAKGEEGLGSLFSQTVSTIGPGQQTACTNGSPRVDATDAMPPKREALVSAVEDRAEQDHKMTQAKILDDLARVLRSKNSGPYEITFDIMFESARTYQLVKDSDILSPAVVARAYHIAEDDVLWSGFFDQALAYKATIPRMRHGKRAASGDFLENDVHGSQMYLPLRNLVLPSDFLARYESLV